MSYVAWDLDKETVQFPNTVVLSDEIRARLIGSQPVSYGDARHIFDDLVSSGLSPAEAREKIVSAAWRVRTSYRDHRAAVPAPAGVNRIPVCARMLPAQPPAHARYDRLVPVSSYPLLLPLEFRRR
jgi:hypothetical protein